MTIFCESICVNNHIFLAFKPVNWMSLANCTVVSHFYRVMLSIRGTSHGPVSVCPSQVGVLSKRLNESSWLLACELPSTRPILC